MFVFRLMAPFLAGVVNLLALETALFSRSLLFPSFIVSLGATTALHFFVLKRGDQKLNTRFLLVLFSFLLASWSVLFFLPLNLFVHGIIVLVSLLVVLYIRATFLFFYTPQRYQPFSLDNAGTYVGILSVFFLASSFFGVGVFLPQPQWVLFVSIFLIFFLFSYLVLWSNKVFERAPYVLLGIIAFVCTQFFWLLSLLPVSIFVQGAIAALVFYYLSGISRAFLLEQLDRHVVWKYSIVSSIVLLVVIGTARWN